MNSHSNASKLVVLIAEDDADDRLLLEVVFQNFSDLLEVKFVKDGEKLLDYLLQGGTNSSFLPGLILLDLNMLKIDGREALLRIKGIPSLKDIPSFIWTTSNEDVDKAFTAKAGVTGYVTKQNDIREIRAAIHDIVNTHPIHPGS